jgi:hypothetical protein
MLIRLNPIIYFTTKTWDVCSFYPQRAGIKPLRSTDASNVTLFKFRVFILPCR